MGKGGGSTEQTTTTEPWGPQQDYLQRGFRRADSAFSDPVRFPDFPTYAGLTDSMVNARDALIGRGSAGSPVIGAGNEWITNTLQNPGVSGGLPGGDAVGRYLDPNYGFNPNQAAEYFQGTPGMDMLAGRAGGNMLGSNPYLDSQYDAAAGRVTENFNRAVVPSINATFGSGGRTGGGLHQEAVGHAAGKLGENLGDMATNMYGNAYNFERGQQDRALNQYAGQGLAGRQAAAGLYGSDANRGLSGANLWGNLYSGDQSNAARAAAMAPTFANQDYTDIQAMLQGGQIDQAQADAMVADRVNRFNHYETGAGSPQDAVARYIAAIQGNYGGTSAATGGGPSSAQQGIGGAISGAAAGSTFGPWGALIGGGLGALSSLF